MSKSNSRKVEITVYETIDDVSRIEYKNHIIQTYGYECGSLDIGLIHFIIDENGHDVCEKDCLIDCINYIDKVKK